MRTQGIAVLNLILLTVAVACGNSGGTEGSSEESASPLAEALAKAAVQELAAAAAETTAEPAKAVPQGPVWRTKMLGQEVTEPLVSKSLAPGGITGVTIQAPEGARVEDWLGSVSVSNDMGFSLWISSKRYNLDQTKRLIERGSSFVKMVRADDTHFIYESKNLTGDGTHYQFQSRIDVNGTPYKCMSNTGAQFRELDLIEQMLAACRTLAPEAAGEAAAEPGSGGGGTP